LTFIGLFWLESKQKILTNQLSCSSKIDKIIIDPFYDFIYRINYQNDDHWSSIAIWMLKNKENIDLSTKIRLLQDSSYFLKHDSEKFKILLGFWKILEQETRHEPIIYGISEIVDVLHWLNCPENTTGKIMDRSRPIIDRFLELRSKISTSDTEKLIWNLDSEIHQRVSILINQFDDQNQSSVNFEPPEMMVLIFQTVFSLNMAFFFFSFPKTGLET